MCLLFAVDLRKKFPCLGLLVEIYLAMAISTAVCERGFSCMKRVKSDWRSSLSSVQLSRLMYLSLEGPSLAEFRPATSVMRWWRSGERPRRPGSTAWTARQNQPTTEDLEHELEELEKEMEDEFAPRLE